MPETETQIDMPMSCKVIRSGQYNGWIEMPAYALVDSHTYYDIEKEIGPDGKEVEKPVPVTLDQQELQRIADECNKRIVRTRDYTPSVIGHTKDGLPSKFQPDIVGLNKDFIVQPFVNPETGEPILDDEGRPKLAIYATPFCKPENLQQFLDHPRRSIELRFREGELDPISLLGAEAPARYLGLHKFSKSEEASRSKPYVYCISETNKKSSATEPQMAEDMDAGLPKQPDDMGGDDKYAAVFEDDRFKKVEATCDKLSAILPQLEQFLAQATGGGEGAEGEMPPAGEGEPFDPNQVGEGDLDMGGGAGAGGAGDDMLPPDASAPPDDTGLDADTTHRNAAACAPGAMNCTVPSMKKKEPTRMSATTQVAAPNIDPAKMDEAIKLQVKKQTAARFSKIEQENAAMKAELAVVTQERELAQVQVLLSALDNEGYPYDPDEETPALVKMSKQEREKRLAYIRKYHEKKLRAPGAGKFPVGDGESATARFSRDEQIKPGTPEAVEVSKVARLAIQKGITVQEARKLHNAEPSANGAITAVR